MNRFLLMTICFALSAAAHADCRDVFYGEINYTDLNKSGQLVHKTNVAPIREWSAQSQFDRVLIEKDAALIGADDRRVQLSVQLEGDGFTASRKVYPVSDWQKNGGFFRAEENLKQAVRREKAALKAIRLAYLLDGRKRCELIVPVRLSE